MKAHMVNSIKQTVSVTVLGKEVELSLSDLADGCIGVSLWFDTEENAIAWADNEDTITEATYKPKEQK